MLLTIHDASLRKVAFIDNDKQATLNYFNDAWTRYLETGSSTFDFTVFKKAIISDVGRKRAYNYLNEKAFVSFQYKGKTYLHTIRKVEENEQIIKCYGINLNLELINEYANPYKAPRAMTFKEYCDAMDLLNFTFLKIGVNEISTQKISAEWEGTDTKLNRLLSLAKKFGAEIEFDTHLNADSSIKSFVVNVYHENDDNHQGVGRVSPTILKYGKNLKALTRTVDKTNIYNMIRPTGKDDQGNTVTISGLGAWSVNNSKGEREFYQVGEGLYAPLSMQMYPAAFTSGTIGDQWIRKDMTVESSNPEVIRSTAYRELKKNCYPAVTYEAEGFADLEIGDTVQVYDDGFSPVLLLEMRVSEQTISFTNPKNNKTTFSNAKALENLLSQGIQKRLDRMIEDAKPYTIKLSTDNGVIFKNQIGQSIITPSLYKGGKPVTSGVTWRWSLDGMVTTGMTYTVRGANVTDTATLTIAAYIGNDEVAVDEISFVNVLDGTMGTPGTPGKDGRTPYVHTAWANNSTGTDGFSLDSSINKLYIGIYTDFEPADSTDPTKYKWTLIKGEKGDKGDDGVAGKDGKGITNTVITYGISASETTQPATWSATVPTLIKGQYLWTKNIWTYTDGKTETGYTKTYIPKDGNNGTNGIAGKDGVGISSTDITYASSSSGTTAPSSGWTASVPNVSPGQYLWTKTIWSYTDNTTETGYSVARIGADGTGLANVTNFYLASNQSTGITVDAIRRNHAEDYDFSRGMWEYSQGDNSTQNWNIGNGIYTLTTTTNTFHQYQIHSESGGRLGGNKDSLALLDLEVGETYTLSVEVKVNSGSPNFWIEVRDNGLSNYNNIVTHLNLGGTNVKATSEWVRYSVTGTIKPNSDFGHRRIILGYSEIGSISFRKVELTRSKEYVNAGPALEDSGWTTTPQQLSYTKRFLWNYRIELYTDGITKAIKPAVIGVYGDKGDQGIPGVKGADGRTQYTHIAYADNATGGGFSQTDQRKAYIGMYQDFTATDSTNPASYRWTKWKGSDGDQGIPGPKGADGQTPYIHFAYSDNSDGTGLTLTDNGQQYMGHYSDYTQVDSTDKTKYRWADRWAKIEYGGRNFALSTATQTNGNQGRIYTLSSDSFKWQTAQKLYLTFDYVASTNVNGFRLNRVIKYNNGTGSQWDFTTNDKVLGKQYIDTSSAKSGTYSQPWEWRPYTNSRTSDLIKEIFLNLDFESGSSGTVVISKLRVNTGTLSMDWIPSPEDTVYKTDISVTDEGIVHSASKTVNGQTIASMIAQRAEWVEIIANLLKVKGDMIVDGTISANKLSVSTLSALAADLGQISGGSLELLESVAQATSVDAWGNFTIPAHKWGLYIDSVGAISSGTPVRKSSSESTASDMPVSVLTSGQLRFARVNQNNDLKSVLHYGLSDPDNATISFVVAPDGTKQLLIQANGQIVNQGTNYTGWNSTGVSGVYYKRQGDVVALRMQVNTTANQTYSLGKIPVSLLPIQNAGTMMRVPAWTVDQSIGRNLQFNNSDGSMVLLSSSRGDAFNTQVTWII